MKVLMDTFHLLLISSIPIVSHGDCPEAFFGPSCEYINSRFWSKNIVVNNSTTTSGDECVAVPSPRGTVVVELENSTIVTWVRVIVRDKNSISSLSITMTLENGHIIQLSDKNRAVSKTTVDMEFEPTPSLVQFVTVEGNVNSTCSIFISLGQNLADNFHELVTQSSTFKDFTADQCTDDDLQTFCHTNESLSSPFFRVYFAYPAYVLYVQLVNRKGAHGTDLETIANRAIGHTITLHLDHTSAVWSYTDPHKQSQELYKVIVNHSELAWGFQVLHTTAQYLNYLEIEVFGDYVCPKGKYGLMCKKDCKCETRASVHCFSNTGGCSSACPPGLRGHDCSEKCLPMTYGLDCAEHCSVNCAGSGTCHPRFGDCTEGCKPGYTPPKCDLEESILDEVSNIAKHLSNLLLLIAVALITAFILCFVVKKFRKKGEEKVGEQE